MKKKLCFQPSMLALIAGIALVAPAQASTPDAWITTKTKLALLTTDGVSGMAINVDTVLGRVTLHGQVETVEEKRKAEAISKEISGVRSVKNLIQVLDPEDESAVKEADDALASRIEELLDNEPSLESSDIDLQSVNRGVVLLGGSAKSMTANLCAIKLVANVPGVKRVSSEVVTPEALVDAEIWRESARRTPDRGHEYASTASDLWITSATKMRMAAESQVPALAINVDTTDGVVTLFGIVESRDAKKAAETCALEVDGVKRVRNHLEVVPAAKQARVEVRDEELESALKEAFSTPELQGIGFEVKNGVVRLTGTVSGGARRIEAGLTARSIRGVRAVQDDLRYEAKGD